MKTAAGIAAAGVLVLMASTGVDRGTTPAPPGVETGTPVDVTGGADEDGLPPRIDYPGDLAFTCDGLRVVWVEPDTPDARVSAGRGCLRMEIGLNGAAWPDGIHP